MNLESPKYFDAHAHVNFTAFDPVRSREGSQRASASNGVDADRDATIQRALDGGVWVCNVGTQKDTSRKAVELAEKYEQGVYAIIGLHPIHTGKSFHDEKELGEGGKEFTSRGEVYDISYYRELARHPKVVAIGECGLDYYRSTEHGTWSTEHKKQEEAFRGQVELAVEVGKPLMLHVRSGSDRSAYRDALAILKSYPKARGNFHFFAGSWEEAKEVLDAGFNLSFTGVITFARNYDEVIKNTPLDRILSETDCPYVAPAPFRGKRNEPLYVQEVVKKIAEIRGDDFGIVKKTIVSNACRFFGLA